MQTNRTSLVKANGFIASIALPDGQAQSWTAGEKAAQLWTLGVNAATHTMGWCKLQDTFRLFVPPTSLLAFWQAIIVVKAGQSWG